MTSSGGEERLAPLPVNDPCSGPHRQEIVEVAEALASALDDHNTDHDARGWEQISEAFVLVKNALRYWPCLTDEETLAHVRRYAEHLMAYASSYGPTENLSDAQRNKRDQIEADGEILLAILNGEEWALRDVTL